MADHAKKGRPKKPAGKRNNSSRGKSASAQSPMQPRVWLMLALVIAIGGGFAYFLSIINDKAPEQEVLVKPKAKKKTVKNNEPMPEMPEESWVYESLDKKEITVELADEQTLKPHSYRLQCASFRTLSQAGEMKAKIAFMGEEPNIKKVKGSTGDWYQVILGPYDTKRHAETTRHKMQRANINTCSIYNWQ